VACGTFGKAPEDAVTEYVYCWGPRLKNYPGTLPQLSRKGQKCMVLARGRMNSAKVEFGDGETAIVSRNSLRRVK
jgi:hypothetical protein